MFKRLIALIGLAALPSAAAAQTPAPASPPAPAPPPCATPEFRQLDFWVGDWDLSFSQGAGQPPGQATNRITRNEYGDCAIVEHFVQPGGRPDGSDYVGTSYSMWDAQTRQWRQMWVDNAGGLFVLTGGVVEGEDHVFQLTTTEPRGGQTPTIRRMIWQDVTADSLVWRWQGRRPDGSWSDLWVLNYTRRK